MLPNLGGGEEFASGGVVLAPNGDMLIAATSASSGLGTTGSFDETLNTPPQAPSELSEKFLFLTLTDGSLDSFDLV